jgi:YesN/AraC family two-component response regulator
MEQKKRCTVLIVEDDLLALEMMREAVRLQFPDVDVCTAANGKAGLHLYTTLLPEVVVTDAVMPEMDGIEMVRSIRSRNSGVKIIMVSGFIDIAGTGEAKQLLDHLLTKPVNYDKMFDAIESCLQESLC